MLYELEDIGIRANFGRPGSFSMGHAIKNIANIQHNRFVKEPNYCSLPLCEEMKEVEHLDFMILTIVPN
jgi:hypothetical protein